jgi:hypothetical protein
VNKDLAIPVRNILVGDYFDVGCVAEIVTQDLPGDETGGSGRFKNTSAEIHSHLF